MNKLLNLIGWHFLPDPDRTFQWRRVFVFSVVCLLVAVTHSLVTGRFWDVHEYYWGTRPGWAW